MQVKVGIHIIYLKQQKQRVRIMQNDTFKDIIILHDTINNAF